MSLQDELEFLSRKGSKLMERGGNLVVQCRVPVNPPQHTPTKPTFVHLGLPAVEASIPRALELVRELRAQLKERRFQPEQWTAKARLQAEVPAAVDSSVSTDQLSFASFAIQVEAMYDAKYPELPKNWNTIWGKKYKSLIKLLKELGSKSCDEEGLYWAIKSINSDSVRENSCSICLETLRFMGVRKWDKEWIAEAGKGYTAAKLNPRDIPSEAEIEAGYAAISQPHWQFMYALMWLCGIRPHEIVGAKIERRNEKHVLLVPDTTKTGYREVWPAPYSTFVELGLYKSKNQCWPRQDKYSVAKAFGDNIRRHTPITFQAYNLRHAYALRLLEKQVSIEVASKMMGHTTKVHETTYERWLDKGRMKAMHQKLSSAFD